MAPQIFPCLGPALMISMGYIDLGKWVAAVEGGASFGFSLLPLVIFLNCCAIFCQYLATSIGVATENNLAQIYSREYSRSVCIMLGIQAEISAIALDISTILGVAHGISILSDLDIVTCILLAMFVAGVLPFFIAHLDTVKAEVVYLGISGFALLFYVLGVLISQPEIPLAFNGIFPKLSGETAYSVMALLGSNIMVHNFYTHSSAVQQKRLVNVSVDALCHDHFFAVLFVFSGIFLVNYVLVNSAASVVNNSGLIVSTFQDAFLLLDQVFKVPIPPIASVLVLLFSSLVTAFSWNIGGLVILRDLLHLSFPPLVHQVLVRTLAAILAFCCAQSTGTEGIYQLLVFCQVVSAMLLPASVIPLFRVASSRSLMGPSKISWQLEILALLTFFGILASNILFSMELLFGNSSWTATLRGGAGDSFSLQFMLIISIACVSLALTLYLAVTPLKSASHVQDFQTWALELRHGHPQLAPDAVVEQEEEEEIEEEKEEEEEEEEYLAVLNPSREHLLTMFKSAIYHVSALLGEADVYLQNPKMNSAWTREIRISHLSPPSERCPPLAVLHTIAPAGPCARIESRSLLPDESPLFLLHATCLREKKTAVISLGEEELHLVAMPSRRNFDKCSRFWGFSTVPGLYNSCLVMLNLRCLGIVFDLDETLIVANTMRSFEDRIDSLQRKINAETDPQRISGMLAEVKRYQDDQCILKQYVENDQVVDSGKVFKVQSEIVPSLSDGHQPMIRPIIRLQEKNIILTRINPLVRDTSVLVRLRPAWEDLRSYLTARGRKRFEVYVCTMAERDYALEMWRLLDPEWNLINSKQLLDRIVCVKSGLRKSLFNVFQDGICHPKMALVIDDRLKVWDDKDQPRVHVVPAFAPYHAPHAEANGAVPVLCVARNVACNVRGGFFKEFDEGLLPRISDVFYEDELVNFPSAPDVGNYLISEDDTSVSNGSKDPLSFDGMADVEVEKRLKEANFNVQAAPSILSNLDPRSVSCLQHVLASSSIVPTPAATQVVSSLHDNQQPLSMGSVKPLVQPGIPESSLQGSPAREEGEVPESELDPNTRRRLLILQHGQDTRDHVPNDSVLPARVPLQVSLNPPIQSHGGWFPVEEEMSPRKLNRAPKDFAFEPEAVRYDKNRPFFPRVDNFSRPERPIHDNQRLPKEIYHGDGQLRPKHAALNYHQAPGDEVPVGRVSISNRDAYFDSWRMTSQYLDTPTGVLLDIATKCGDKVEFRAALVDTTELQFSIEVWFVGEKVGEGIGRTRKEAQHHASESSLRNLANKYLSSFSVDPDSMHDEVSYAKENGSVSGKSSFQYPAYRGDEPLPSSLEQARFQDPRVDRSRPSGADLAALKELCALEGFSLNFLTQPGVSIDPATKGEVTAQVEIGGQLLGKGSGMSREEAKLQAAQEALVNLQSMLGQFAPKRSSSPRLAHAMSSKRLKQDLPRGLQRASSARYSRDDAPVL